MERYYLEHVTNLGEKHEVYASEDIQNTFGVKLIAKGIRINPHFLDQLLKHKLNKPVDAYLEISGALTPTKIRDCAVSAFEKSSELRKLFEHLASFTDLAKYLNCLLLNKILLNKLSVMQHRLPTQFEHSLRVALICLFIGKICKVSEPEMQHLAMIGLFHDIGVLHIDPILLNDDKELDASEWKQMFAHPIIGFLILQKQAGLPEIIARAVLEHHERIDGSGYPKHLTDSEMGKLGRIIALAEIIVGIYQKSSCEHLVTILKTNIENVDKEILEKICHSLYESKLMGHLALDEQPLSWSSEKEILDVENLAEAISAIFLRWEQTFEKLNNKNTVRLNDRIHAIFHGLTKAGISPLDAVGSIKQYDQDLLAIREAKSLLIETVYQLRNILRIEMQRYADDNYLPEKIQSWFTFSEQKLNNIESILR
ncbi:MAG: HD-GYP domain-containing protein [Gammaproteobacteria bacterium]